VIARVGKSGQAGEAFFDLAFVCSVDSLYELVVEFELGLEGGFGDAGRSRWMGCLYSFAFCPPGEVE
jgi:hypothetical protein